MRHAVVADGSLVVPGLDVRVLALPSHPHVSGVQIISARQPFEIEATPGEHAINVLLAGESRVGWQGRGFSLDKKVRAGQVTFVPATSDPYRFAFDGHPKSLRISIPQAALSALAADARHNPTELRPALGEADPVMWRYANELAHELERPGLASSLYIDSLITAIIVNLVRRYALATTAPIPSASGLSATRLRLVCDYVEENLHGEIDLASLAAAACLSKSHFLRSFKQRMGMTPHQYVIGRRIARASQLLANADLPIAEVAYLLGFSSQSHFTSAFRQSTGLTPKAFRAAQR